MARRWVSFSYRGAVLRIASDRIEVAQDAIRRQRDLLDVYARHHPDFLVSMTPLDLLPGAPEIAVRMARAGWKVGVGPMAAVAGAVAELAARAALDAGAEEAIVDNGGDAYLASREEVVVGLYAGGARAGSGLALRVTPDRMPLAICSSSSRLGHSLSLGSCDLATVVGTDAALADAAATLACNLVHSPGDVEVALGAIASIPGVAGVLVVSEDRVGMAGDLPELVRHRDGELQGKITRHPGARLE
jgi:ApbE superfamily uncharacterized protein (UPF0280 family)